ncbi:type II secretion system F family protein [Oribacterium sp. WCC10]|uniref:type II secretion system F family protein n=1 Tax=Oribacterium sp. WCC10 TaxID=1855343 RepID=UPI0015878972|nr:type II secretion system F family protein [Oribacterium sp. WCC10]
MKEQILCIAVSLFLSAIVFFSSFTDSVITNGNLIKRSAYGSSNKTISIEVSGLSESKNIPLDITVNSRRYTKEEADHVFSEIVENIEGIIIKDEQSLACVSHDLQLVTRLKDYGIELSWDFYPETDDPTDYRKYRHLIEDDGTVHNEDIPEGSVINGYLSLIMSTYIVPEAQNDTEQDSKDYIKIKYHSEPYKIYVNVVPKRLSEHELLLKALNDRISAANLSTLGEDSLSLPLELDGLSLSYHEAQDHTYIIFPFLGIIAAIAIYLRHGSQKKEEKKKRENMLMLDYSDLVSKLMVYTGAGLTIKNSFISISESYDNLVNRGVKPDRPLSKELRTLCHQFHRNMPESEVYLDFGRRINLKPYTKLISLIEQNRKTGTKNLRAMLELEMNDAFDQRKNAAKRLGEEAGTKLLLPLFLMLSIVMVIVIVPALTAIS